MLATRSWSAPPLTRPPPTAYAFRIMPTPFTDAPDALLHLWNKFALSGDLDGSTPPATMREAYNQVVAIQLRQMRDGGGRQSTRKCSTCSTWMAPVHPLAACAGRVH